MDQRSAEYDRHLVNRPVSYSTYVKLGCRCKGCTEQNRLYNKERRARLRSELLHLREYAASLEPSRAE
jgi:hypothetical protein